MSEVRPALETLRDLGLNIAAIGDDPFNERSA